MCLEISSREWDRYFMLQWMSMWEHLWLLDMGTRGRQPSRLLYNAWEYKDSCLLRSLRELCRNSLDLVPFQVSCPRNSPKQGATAVKEAPMCLRAGRDWTGVQFGKCAIGRKLNRCATTNSKILNSWCLTYKWHQPPACVSRRGSNINNVYLL